MRIFDSSSPDGKLWFLEAYVSVNVSVKAKRPSEDDRKLLHLLMRPARLERATFWFVAKRSIQLSYGRV